MSVSNIQSNLSALLNKAYSTDSSSTTDAISQLSKQASEATNTSTSASAEVTLGATSKTTETYTAQGLMQQLRQYQLSNASLMFGSDGGSSDDSTGLSGLMGATSDTDVESTTQDWVNTISENPDKASVMVATSRNNSISTILGK